MKRLILNIKLLYYTLLEYFHEPSINLPNESIQQSRQNVKLTRGVRKLVGRLRSMSLSDRLETENLLSKSVYKKNKTEIREELQVRHKVMNNPIIRTEDDLVMNVVRKAPRYQKEQELSDVRKALTACLRASSADPSNPTYVHEARRLKAKLSGLRGEIERMKKNG